MRDGFGRDINYMRVSVTDLCNLRCRYCMPEEGVEKKDHETILSREELFTIVESAARLGISKIRLTGGEPLVKRGIVEICETIRHTEGIKELDLTTNGILLKELAGPLRKAGVDRLNISLDTLREDRYHYITRVGNLEDVRAGIAAAEDAGFTGLKINVVLMKGFNEDEIEDFVNLTREHDFEVRFIEMMPIGEAASLSSSGYLPAETVLQAVPDLVPLNVEKNRRGVAELYALPKFFGRVGLIRPVSCRFCEECNKIRLTADGKIKPCLHLKDEISLKGLSPAETEEALRKIIEEKPAGHAGLESNHPSEAGRFMNQIGG